MTLTITDLFAGFGGASSGAVQVPGVDIRIAANHWDLAIEVHNANHPDAEHAHVDLHLEDPRRFPKTDILWASPECTQWSQANGKKADLAPILGGWSLFDDLEEDLQCDKDAATRSRLLMFDVLRFADYHRYKYMVIENVVDIATRPKYAAAWTAWQKGLRNLGYSYRVVSLNSMHAQAFGQPAPQSRDRLYVVCWLNKLPAPDIDRVMRPQAFCGRCDRVVESFQAWKPNRSVGKYRAQYVYLCSTAGCGEMVEPGWLPASHAIDWTIQGKRIGDREKDLAPKTRRRIAAGIARYWSPLHIEAGGNQYDAADPKHVRYDDPNAYYRAWPTEEPLKVLHTAETKALVQPPFIAEFRGGGSDARLASDPLSTVTAGGNHHALLTPYYGNAQSSRSADHPVGTLTTVDRYALITRHYSQSGDQSHLTKPINEALGTLTTTAQQSIVTPGDLAVAEAQVDDCLFRMLEPHEVGAGMAFDRDYIVMGSRRNQVKGYGNAVTPPAARDLIGAVVEAYHQIEVRAAA